MTTSAPTPVSATKRSFTAALCLSAAMLMGGSALAAGSSDTDAERLERWRDISKSIFGDRTIEPTDALIKVDAPPRALDASLVPITLMMPEKDRIAAVHLIIDDNPSPYAAHITFGPAADPSEVKLRVRINNYTNVHAVAETKDGKLYEAVKFVKASGGCSAPMGMSDEEALKGAGDMKMKFADGGQGKPTEATLMVRHPNFSGMQMNQITRDYTPARYINKLDVSSNGTLVFSMNGDISIASNPVINFALAPDAKGPIKVVATDNQQSRWEHSFNTPTPSN
ncbi:quinoprotein dehydrogenase-associated SoxYZ-like carrier [Methylobacterium sp. Leaf93]|uniref:quinoprotein dehydrogenase-associated SoxYZ-like carrier n=1 Tax=Methylobacterium sp. Leaf93 TaxID=1736249 RepID=UPI0006F4C171|nr:quinoprotein dehydrogenase-associated SoxYZ-like carrier [Methylobacterium sp. Leaf93]KQP16412.1 quinoprotein dehydrogenase-associated SoxYZ-like carrier [Methylobacterium sp. Leaf93]